MKVRNVTCADAMNVIAAAVPVKVRPSGCQPQQRGLGAGPQPDELAKYKLIWGG